MLGHVNGKNLALKTCSFWELLSEFQREDENA
jgi:hypothetical protein